MPSKLNVLFFMLFSCTLYLFQIYIINIVYIDKHFGYIFELI